MAMIEEGGGRELEDRVAQVFETLVGFFVFTGLVEVGAVDECVPQEMEIFGGHGEVGEEVGQVS